jgi:mannose-6-phosphate isomerase-like protein (cupin superfamily)
MKYVPINFQQKLSLFSEHWKPKVIAEMNDYQFKIVKIQGEFVWHSHAGTDEVFMVIEGRLRLEFRDGKVELKAGEMYVVPMGVEHRPVAEQECKMLLIEPRGTVNTGDVGGAMTAENDVWISGSEGVSHAGSCGSGSGGYRREPAVLCGGARAPGVCPQGGREVIGFW